MTKNLVALAMSLLIFAFGSVAQAAPEPQQVVRETSDQVLAALSARKNELSQQPEQLYRLVDDIVLPRFDFELMSRWVLGKNWNKATPEQRDRFSKAFRDLLVRTYSNALLEYTDEKINYLPVAAPNGATEVTVKTEIRPSSGPSIPVNYEMHQGNDGWKVYDVAIDGVSLVTSYRSTFANQIRREGMDAVIASLERGDPGQG